MRIEVTVPRLETRDWIVGGGCLLWILISLLGYVMTRQMAEAVPLTRERWQELHIQRETQEDLRRLEQDLAQLTALSQTDHPDPVSTLALAQRIYHRHLAGAITTTAARRALIQAAEMAVQVSYGAQERPQLVTRLQMAEKYTERMRSP